MVEPFAGAVSSLRGQVLADKRKFAVLGGLLLVLTVAVGRLLLSDATPASVEGALLVPDSPALKTTHVIPEPPSPAPADTPSREILRSGPRRAGGSGAQSGKRPHDDVAALPRILSRDVFTAADWSVFPRVARHRGPHTGHQVLLLARRAGDQQARGRALGHDRQFHEAFGWSVPGRCSSHRYR